MEKMTTQKGIKTDLKTEEEDSSQITPVSWEKKDQIKKSIKKQLQPSFYKRYEDPIGFAIVFVVVGLVYYLNKRGNEMNILKNDVIDKDLINSVNNSDSMFSLKGNKFFEEKTLEKAKEYSHNLFSTHNKVE